MLELLKLISYLIHLNGYVNISFSIVSSRGLFRNGIDFLKRLHYYYCCRFSKNCLTTYLSVAM